jgi:hypothetical protein
MITGRVRHRQMLYRAVFVAPFALLLLLGISVLTGCGSSPPPDRPLIASLTDPTANVVVRPATGQKIEPIQVVTAQSNLISYPNGPLILTIVTSPFALCNFLISYNLPTPSNAFGIVPKTADEHGIVTWQWQVEGKAATGIWPLSITASLVNGSRTTNVVNVSVKLPPVNLVSSKSVLAVARKSDATLTISTAPFLNCTVTLSYLKRAKVFKGTADAKGFLSWTWKVEAEAPVGTTLLTVLATTGSGEQLSVRFPLSIQ